MSPFGDELRRLRRQAGLSLPVLADRIHYSKGYLSKVETGAVRPNTSLAQLCDAELDTGGALAALLPESLGQRRVRRAATPRLSGLPAVTTHFTGRSDEVEEILAVLREDAAGGPQVCAISGMPGVGKTTLAVRCAYRLESGFSDGCLFLDLRGHEVTATDALDRLLRMLDVAGEAIPSHVDDRAAAFRNRLRGRNLLLVLDNAGSASQVLPLLPGGPGCRVLVTSRNRLPALDDAHHVQVGVLSTVDALALFRSLAAGEHDERLLSQIVDRCGRLPLAIRIAAARLTANPAWRLTDLERRLTDRLGELDDGERSVAAVFRVALDDVPEEQRRLFALLGLHPGPDLDTNTAAALADLTVPAAERLLERLRDAHLIGQQPTGRYQFHDLLAGFASAEAASLPQQQSDAAIHRLLDMELYHTDTADRLLEPQRFRRDLDFERPRVARDFTGKEDALAWFRQEWQSLVGLCRLAMDRGAHGRCWHLAFSLRGFFFLSKLWDPWILTQEIALPAAQATEDAWAEAVTLNNIGVAMIDKGELDIAAGYYDRALDRFREISDQHGVNTTLANAAWVSHYHGDHRQALRNLHTALDFYEGKGHPRYAAITLRGIALAETALGSYQDAVEHAERALSTFEELDLVLDAAMACNCLGWNHYNAGRMQEADAWYRDALARSERCGSTYEAARAETGLGNVAAAQGRDEDARRHWAQADNAGIPLRPLMAGEARARLAAEQ